MRIKSSSVSLQVVIVQLVVASLLGLISIEYHLWERLCVCVPVSLISLEHQLWDRIGVRSCFQCCIFLL